MILAALAYSFVVGQPVSFDVNVRFEGWIPLFGGREGKANVNMTVVANAIRDGEVESSISKIDAEAFGVVLPLNSNNVDQFFPKATAVFDASGVVTKNTAPAIKMPAKLPGLDSQRLPEISYLPLALPRKELAKGESYTFTRSYGGQDFKYTATLTDNSETAADFKIQISSQRDGFEDAYGNAAETEKGAKKKTRALLDGTGVAHFSKTLGSFDTVEVTTTEVTTAAPISGGKETSKTLKTTLKIKRQTP